MSLEYVCSHHTSQPTAGGGTTGCQFTTNFYNNNGTIVTTSDYTCPNRISLDGGLSFTGCGMSETYIDGSYVGALARTDSLTMGPYSGPTIFGAAFNASSDFIAAGADGIWGMMRPAKAVGFLSGQGPLTTLFNAGMPKQFAMCMSATGGDLHLGGYDRTYASGAISWFTYDPDFSAYTLFLSGVGVGDSRVAEPHGSVVIDSGSTFTLFPLGLYTALVDKIKNVCPECNADVFDTNAYQTVNPADYPSITVSLALDTTTNANTTYTLTGAQYLLANPSNPNQYTSGFVVSSGSTSFVFGQSFLRNWYTIFDIAYGAIGIGNLAPGKCTAALAPTGERTTLSPSSTQPPPTTVVLAPQANAPAPRGPAAPAPTTGGGGSPAAGATPPPPSSAAPQQSPAVFSSVLVVVLLAALFFLH